MTPNQLQQRSYILNRAALIVALAVLMRIASIALHNLEQENDKKYGDLNFLSLPVLELLSLALMFGVLLNYQSRILNFGKILLMATMINAILNIIDFLRWSETCAGDDYYRYEDLCDQMFMQSYCNIPFVVIGSVILLLWLFEPSEVSQRL